MANVLVIAPYVPHPARHGGAIRTRVLLDALAADHAVHLAVPVGDAAEAAAARALAGELGAAVHALPRAAGRGGPWRKAGHWLRGRSELLARRWGAGAATALQAAVAGVRFDLAVADSSFALPLLRPAPAPLLLFLHNVESAVFARGDAVARGLGERLSRAAESRLMRAEERAALRAARAAVVVSDHDRALAHELAPGAPVEVVPNSVDLAALPLLPPAPPGPPRLLFIGKLDYPPNREAVGELVATHLPALRQAFPGLVVRIVGADAGGHAATWRAVPGVEVVGAADDLLPHYRQSHAAYLPIRSGGGTRIKVLEALALGLPVLSTAVGAEGLLAEDGVHLRRFETPAEGVAALRAVLGGAAEGLRARGRQLVEAHYSHEAARTRLRALIGRWVR